MIQIATSGGTTITYAEIPSAPQGLTWNDDPATRGQIVHWQWAEPGRTDGGRGDIYARRIDDSDRSVTCYKRTK